MAANRSEKCPFSSRYGGGFLSAGQFAAEAMCARMAAKRGVTLPQKFWTLPTWELTFRLQLKAANAILKIYDFEVLKAALNTKQGKKIYSLAAKWLTPLLEVEQLKLNNKQESVQDEEQTQPSPANLPTGPRPTFTNSKTKLNKLREMDS